ncbi:excinuclease ABC subunit UvrC [Spirochaetota bacterium]
MKSKGKIQNFLANAPNNMGVYLMKDSRGKIIYIGKASSLKKRLASYYQKKETDPKTTVLVKNISDIEYIITDTEAEALILENSLIKKHMPRFNIRLKDDKRYPYIEVTLGENYPRIVYTRRLNNKKSIYFGPYTDSKAARNIISMINYIFKLKTCKKKLPLSKDERPCLNFQMKRCSGSCTGKISKEDYRNLVENAVTFLKGDIDPVLKNLNEQMDAYSGNQHYEDAARIRDIIFDIQKLSETQKVYAPVGMDQDYIALSKDEAESILVLFEFRKGVLLGRKIFIFDNIKYASLEEIIRSFILDYYENSDVPQRIITQHEIDDARSIGSMFTEKSSKKVSIITPKTPVDKAVINMILKNIDVIGADRKASKQYENRKEGLSRLMKVLGMKKIPHVIECFDISNLQGTFAVASMVSFMNGSPDKKNYRRYKIRGYDSPNDPGMIHEVVGRRIQHLVNEGYELPDLVVIDGGKGQLSRAIESANNFDADIKIISIAKGNEEIFYDVRKKSIVLEKTSPALKIIQNIRDEAHRFAISYHRKLRDKDLTGSVLDEITGLSSAIKKSLLRHFKSIDNIKKSDMAGLKSIPGIGEKTAIKIYGFFHPGKS